MSAIILTQPPPLTRPTIKRKLTTPGLTTTVGATERTPLLDGQSDSGSEDEDEEATNGGTTSTSNSNGQKSRTRTKPLRDSLSTARFVTICIGIFSANFTFAFQSTSVPTLMTGISSGFGHAELGSYLGSVFTLANTAGESTLGSRPSSDSERA